MRHFLFRLGFPVLLFIPVCAPAQSAEEIIERSVTAYAALRSCSVELTHRNVELRLEEGGSEEAPNHAVISTRPQQINLKLRLVPDEWMVVIREGRSEKTDGVSFERTLPNGYHALVQVGGITRQSVFGPEGVSFEPLANAGGLRVVAAFAAKQWSDDLVLNPLLDGQAGGNALRQLNAPVLESEENGVYLIAATLKSGPPVRVWIDKGTGFITRTVTVYQGNPETGALHLGGRPIATIRESRYSYSLNAQLSSKDFNLKLPSRLAPFEPEQLGFAGVAELVQTSGVRPPERDDLSAAQFKMLVGVGSGDEQRTGFVTKIRGSSFVVTSQGALAGNGKLAVIDAQGAEVPVLGIFGATGADIALLRIDPVEGELRLIEKPDGIAVSGRRIEVITRIPKVGSPRRDFAQIGAVASGSFELGTHLESESAGAPIIDSDTRQVIGVAARVNAKQLVVREGAAGPSVVFKDAGVRWIGLRFDGVAGWEPINLARFRSQGEQLGRFRAVSDSLMALVKLDFRRASAEPRLAKLIGDHQVQAKLLRNNGEAMRRVTRDMVYSVRTLAEADLSALKSSDFHDYYRSSRKWEDSVAAQVEYRSALIDIMKKNEASLVGNLARMSGG